MIGKRNFRVTNCRCNCRPLMSGICTSRIKQLHLFKQSEPRNSSAEPKTSTRYPDELMTRFSDLPTSSSSSTIATIEKLSTLVLKISGNSESDGLMRRAEIVRSDRVPKWSKTNCVYPTGQLAAFTQTGAPSSQNSERDGGTSGDFSLLELWSSC